MNNGTKINTKYKIKCDGGVGGVGGDDGNLVVLVCD